MGRKLEAVLRAPHLCEELQLGQPCGAHTGPHTNPQERRVLFTQAFTTKRLLLSQTAQNFSFETKFSQLNSCMGGVVGSQMEPGE